MKKSPKLPIKAIELGGEIKTGKISEIKSGKRPTVVIKNAIVVYVDILGFSKKTKVKDIENTLLDFGGSLSIASDIFKKIRFNVFSDNAFLATSQENAKELISVLRFVFQRWTSNSMLIRGGIAIGEYREFSSVAMQSTSSNFIGNHFAGTAVIKAVELEKNHEGAFIFTDKKCAEFISKRLNEPIFTNNDKKFIGWSDNDYTLFQFTAISLFRLLKLLKHKTK